MSELGPAEFLAAPETGWQAALKNSSKIRAFNCHQ